MSRWCSSGGRLAAMGLAAQQWVVVCPEMRRPRWAGGVGKESATGRLVSSSVEGYSDPRLGMTVEAKARGLLTHDDSDYTEWGASGSVRIDPGASDRDLALTLTPAWGSDTGGAERLWGLRDAGSCRQRQLRADGPSRRRGGLGLRGLRRVRPDDAVRRPCALGGGQPHLARRRALVAPAGRGVRRRRHIARGRQRQLGRARNRVPVCGALVTSRPMARAGGSATQRPIRAAARCARAPRPARDGHIVQDGLGPNWWRGGAAEVGAIVMFPSQLFEPAIW